MNRKTEEVAKINIEKFAVQYCASRYLFDATAWVSSDHCMELFGGVDQGLGVICVSREYLGGDSGPHRDAMKKLIAGTAS